jgi:hypothetical protein
MDPKYFEERTGIPATKIEVETEEFEPEEKLTEKVKKKLSNLYQ